MKTQSSSSCNMKSLIRKSRYSLAVKKVRKSGMTCTDFSQSSDIAQRNKPVPFTVFTDLFATIAYCPLVEGLSVPIFLRLIVRHYHDQIEHEGRAITINKLRLNKYGNFGGTSVVKSLSLSRFVGRCRLASC